MPAFRLRVKLRRTTIASATVVSRTSSHLDDALARFLEIYDTRLLQHTRLYGGVTEVLQCARTLGGVALLTNKPLAPSVKILEGLGIRDLFDAVTGGDGPLGRKPDPAGLHAEEHVNAGRLQIGVEHRHFRALAGRQEGEIGGEVALAGPTAERMDGD